MVESKFSRNVHLAPPHPTPAAVRHSGRSLVPAAGRGARTLPPSGTAAGSFFYFFIFKTLLTFLKTAN
jgi:hypothetical protein